MSFGIRSLKKKQENVKEKAQHKFVKNVLVGEDICVFLKAINFKEKGIPFQIIVENDLNLDLLLKKWSNTLSSVTNSELKELLKAKYPQLEIKGFANALFYKDSKFHEFGARTKNFELKIGEEYYTQGIYDIDLTSVFRDKYEMLASILSENTVKKIIVELEVTEPQDLVEVEHFKLHLSDYDTIGVETLYWSESPKKLFKLATLKEKLGEAFNQYSSEIELYAGLVVDFKYNLVKENEAFSELIDKLVFLPQSVTHEWGHFICMIKNDSILCQCILSSEEGFNEEDLAKKIRLMKRVIERVFDHLKIDETNEAIWFDENFWAEGQNDKQYFASNRNENLKMLGNFAPIMDDVIGAALEARGLLNL